MFERYRAWLQSELTLLGNASHHAYAFGQANMAKRALERLDEELQSSAGGDEPATFSLTLTPGELRDAIDALESTGGSHPAIVTLRARLVEAAGRLATGAEPSQT